MRLTRVKGPPDGSGLLLADAPASVAVQATPVDYVGTFEVEYKRMHPPLISYAERFLSREEAADAVGDTWEAVWRLWPSLVREKRGDGYYYSAVNHAIEDRRIANDRFVPLDDAGAELDRRACEVAPRPSRADTKSEIVAAAIAAMPERRRAVILLIKEQDLSYQETADALGISIGTVNTHMRLAMDDIRAAVARAGQDAAQLAPPQAPRLPSPKGGDLND